MRSIKFRVYDKQQESFVNEPYYAISLLGTLQIEGHTSVEPQRYVIQQFTGLSDSHGNEIYEGDIIRAGIAKKDRIGSPFVGRIYWSEQEHSWWVTNDKDTPIAGIDYDLTYLNAYQDFEVIGNIYQNSDLVLC
jgi:uncharacterized phage protein (TIGR01671 family)